MGGWVELKGKAKPAPRFEDGVRLGVVHPLAVTEALLAQAAFAGLRRALPRAHLTLLGPSAGELQRLHGLFNEVVTCEEALPAGTCADHSASGPATTGLGIGHAHKSACEQVHQRVQVLQRLSLDGLLVFRGPGESPHGWAYLAHLAGVPVRLGASAEFGGRVLTTQMAPLPLLTNSAKRHVALLRLASVEAQDVPPRFEPDEEASRQAAELLLSAEVPTSYCLLDAGLELGGVPRGGREQQEWLRLIQGARDLLAGVGRACRNQTRGVALVEYAQPARGRQQAGSLAQSAVAQDDAFAPRISCSSLALLAALAAAARLVFAGDGPLLQLAAAFGRPLVAVFPDHTAAAQRRPLSDGAANARVLLSPTNRPVVAADLLRAGASLLGVPRLPS